MNRTVVLLLWCAASATAESNLGAPVVGVARDTRGHLRPVYGVAGNFLLRDAIPEAVLNWVFDGAGGLLKTDAELLTLDAGGNVTGRRATPRGDAVLSAGAAFFPATSELWPIGAQGDRRVLVEPGAIAGSVIALEPAKVHSAQLAVCRANQLWLLSIDTTNGAVTRELAAGGTIGEQACHPARTGSLVMMGGHLILAIPHGLLIQTAAGVGRHIPISAGYAAAPELHQAGEQWVQVESAGAPVLMLRVTAEGETLYQLPAAKESK